MSRVHAGERQGRWARAAAWWSRWITAWSVKPRLPLLRWGAPNMYFIYGIFTVSFWGAAVGALQAAITGGDPDTFAGTSRPLNALTAVALAVLAFWMTGFAAAFLNRPVARQDEYDDALAEWAAAHSSTARDEPVGQHATHARADDPD